MPQPICLAAWFVQQDILWHEPIDGMSTRARTRHKAPTGWWGAFFVPENGS